MIILSNMQTNRQTDGQTDTQTDREMGGQQNKRIGRRTYMHSDRQIDR
jgi:hypothetical protein